MIITVATSSNAINKLNKRQLYEIFNNTYGYTYKHMYICIYFIYIYTYIRHLYGLQFMFNYYTYIFHMHTDAYIAYSMHASLYKYKRQFN